jgi:hypothetical protein
LAVNDPCGSAFTVITADPPVKAAFLTHPLASVTDTSAYVVVTVTGVVNVANGVPLTTPAAVRFAPPFSVYTTVNGPVPALAVQVRSPAPVAQKGPLAVNEPCGNVLTVITADPPVNAAFLTQPLASVTDTSAYVVVTITGVVNVANDVPLTTPAAIRFAPPFSVYTTVYGPVPAVAVQVRSPAPVAQNGPFAVNDPCGSAFTVITADPPVKAALRTHPLASVTDTRAYVVVTITGVVNVANGVPLTTPAAVLFAPPFSV